MGAGNIPQPRKKDTLALVTVSGSTPSIFKGGCQVSSPSPVKLEPTASYPSHSQTLQSSLLL